MYSRTFEYDGGEAIVLFGFALQNTLCDFFADAKRGAAGAKLLNAVVSDSGRMQKKAHCCLGTCVQERVAGEDAKAVAVIQLLVIGFKLWHEHTPVQS